MYMEEGKAVLLFFFLVGPSPMATGNSMERSDVEGSYYPITHRTPNQMNVSGDGNVGCSAMCTNDYALEERGVY